ncbi:MAG: hypothetical protein GY913_12775 [Proteobacteria bacterium]|nr:hypothetical protein [Pseudomonadota bacterium]MCP4917780.1 hypothetical protein [Pseudomonadota bacterium]
MLLITLLACEDDLNTCEGYGEPEALGAVDDAIDEASGLAISTSNIVWTHNDSGDTPRVFAMDLSADLLGTWTLTGVPSGDLEDIAFGPDGLVLGDIGDNDKDRDTVRILRFAEPSDPSDDGAITDVEELTLSYDNGPRDAEALIVDDDGTIYVFDKKKDGDTRLYRVDEDAGLLEEVHRFQVPGGGNVAVTGADLTPDADRLFLRTRDKILMYSRAEGASWADVLDGTPCSVSVADELQGEAVGAASWGILSLSEGRNSTLFRYAKQ